MAASQASSTSSNETTPQLTSKITQVIKQISGSQLESYILNSVQEYISSGKHNGFSIEKDISDAITASGYKTVLENTVYKEMQKLSSQDTSTSGSCLATEEEKREPLSCIRKAQVNWEKRVAKSLNTMCTELNLPLAKARTEKEASDLASHWTEIGVMELDVSNIRPVYGPKDFLEVLVNITIPNRNEALLSQYWGMLQVPIPIQSLNDLRVQYNEMAINQCQHGVDDELGVPQELFNQDRVKLGRRVLTSQSSILAREFSKRGCPCSLRANLWKLMLGLEVTSVDKLYYEQLKDSVLKYDLLVDLLYYKDIKLTATNDDQYFVFEDYVFQVLLPFSRDTSVLELTKTSITSPFKSYIRGKLGVEEYSVLYPPNGVIPFYGFSMFVAPLCYVYDDVHTLYCVFKDLYMRYFHKLHIISSDRQSILGLGILFETLLQTQEPQLFFHLKTNDIQPLKIVFKWLMRAFSGFLSSKQNLLLWDKVLAYDSLEILSVFAVSIFSFRKLNLFQVKTQSQAESVLADLTTIKVAPLLQLSLFSKSQLNSKGLSFSILL